MRHAGEQGAARLLDPNLPGLCPGLGFTTLTTLIDSKVRLDHVVNGIAFIAGFHNHLTQVIALKGLC